VKTLFYQPPVPHLARAIYIDSGPSNKQQFQKLYHYNCPSISQKYTDLKKRQHELERKAMLYIDSGAIRNEEEEQVLAENIRKVRRDLKNVSSQYYQCQICYYAIFEEYPETQLGRNMKQILKFNEEYVQPKDRLKQEANQDAKAGMNDNREQKIQSIKPTPQIERQVANPDDQPNSQSLKPVAPTKEWSSTSAVSGTTQPQPDKSKGTESTPQEVTPEDKKILTPDDQSQPPRDNKPQFPQEVRKTKVKGKDKTGVDDN